MPENRAILALKSANDDWLRLWCNGVLVRAQSLQLNPPVPGPLRLKAGWNTILAKIVNWEGPASLTLKLTEDYAEIARSLAASAEKTSWSDDRDSALEESYSLVPAQRGAWENSAEELASLVAQRDGVFKRMIATRPHDSLLHQERARHLAWLGKWDESLAGYDQMIHDHTDPEDAFVEYALVLLLKGDVAGYRKWVASISEKFARTPGPFVGTMLVRACGAIPDSGIEASRLVSWAEQTMAKKPKEGATLHCLGLAHYRAGQFSEAIADFQASLDSGEEGARNWYGLALSQFRLGNGVEAIRWLDKANAWSAKTELEFADRTTHRSPPIYITDWLETRLLKHEADGLFSTRRLGEAVVLDQNVKAGEEFRMALGAVALHRDPPGNLPGSMEIIVPFRSKSPFADGVIGPGEYGPPLEIDFTADVNPGRLLSGGKAGGRQKRPERPTSTSPTPRATSSSRCACTMTRLPFRRVLMV